MKKVFTLLIALLLAITGSWAQTSNYFNGFETTVAAGDWGSTVIRASGYNSIPSSTGSFYGETGQDDFTRFGGYNTVFPTLGFKTSIDIYLNVDGGYANDKRFDYSSAINGTDGAHKRDFVFSGGFYNDATGPGVPNTNRFIFNASNNTPGWPKDASRNPIAISTSGWYTFEHYFHNNGSGVLTVDLSIYNSSDVLMGTWTLSNPADLIGTVIGGNRYGWMVTNQLGTLAIDNSTLTLINPTPITNIGTSSSSACGTLDVPVTVKDFRSVGAISLVLNFDPATLQLLPIGAPPFQGVTLNPALEVSGAPSCYNTIGQFRFGDFPVPAITLADDAVLFTLHFNVLPAAVGGTTTPLTWSTVQGECEYAGPGGAPVYLSTFNPGFATIPVRPVVNTSANPDKAYCTIQAAINDAAPNDVIEVAAGTYAENLTINKSLTLLGPNAANSGCGSRVAEAIIVPATSSPADWSSQLVLLTADNVVIKGLTFDGDNPLLTDVYNVSQGIVGWSGQANITIQNNIIKNLATVGVGLANDAPGANMTSGNIVDNNKFDNINPTAGFGIGIYTGNNTYVDITNNCMTNVRKGIQGGENNHKANAGNVSPVWSGNTIQSYKIGIWNNLAYSAATPVTITGNTVTTVAGSTINSGIEISSVQSAVSVTILNNTVTGAMAGINLWNNPTTATVTVGLNTFTDCDYGVFANNYDGYNSNADPSKYIIDGTQIVNPKIAGVFVKDNPLNTNGATVSAEVKSVTITGAPTGVLVSGPEAGANIHNNTISASAAGINVNGTVTSATNGLTIATNSVTLTSQLAGSTPTVGIALSNVSGTMAATVSDNTITNPFVGYSVYALSTSPVTNITGGTITGIMMGVVASNLENSLRAPSTLGVSNMSISGFTGTGSFQAGVYVYTGGAVANTSITATVDKVTVIGTGKTQQDAAGLSFADFSTLATAGQNITVTECTLTDNKNRGINIRGANANVTVLRSTLTGNGKDAYGTGDNNGYGIVVFANANATVQNCFITNPATSTTEVSALFTFPYPVSEGGTINATNNSLDRNGNGLLANNAGGTLNATCNWLGSTVPASNAAAMNGTVAYNPWLCSGLDTDGGTAGFQGVPCNSGAPAVPANGLASVECLISAIPPATPEVKDVDLTTNLVPVLVSTVDAPNPITCEGTRTYTYSYTNCSGITALWSFVYTIDHITAPVIPVAGGSVVECLTSVTAPTPPTGIVDVCGATVLAVAAAPAYVDAPATITCEGTRTYSFTYTDCAGLVSTWNYVYTIKHLTAPGEVGGPVANASTVECVSAAVEPTVFPVVKDVCSNVVSPTGGVVKKSVYVNKFDEAVVLSATQTPGVWYTDRYAPAGFAKATFDGSNRLKHSILATDGASSRPSAYSTAFYNTQGRKYDLGAATDAIEVKLYIPADWATSNKRMAGLWGTAFNASNAVSGYPIIEFTSDGGVARFRAYETGTGAWIDMGLPAEFAYNSWVTLKIKLLANGEFLYNAGSKSCISTTGAPDASVKIVNVILQGHNYDPVTPTNGVTYDIYWDDFTWNDTYAAITCEGAVSYTYNYADCAGLAYAWTYTYTVDDNTAPAITACAPAVTVHMNDGCTATGVVLGTPTATDNCGGAVTFTNNAPVAFPVGETIVIWKAKDCAGNESTCNQTVTVVKNAISGTLVYNNNPKTPMNLVKMVIKQAGVQVGAEVTTTGTGAFTFPNLCAGTYTIHITDNQKDAGGINATDAAQVNAWSVTSGSAPIEHVKFLAGEVALSDKVITSADALKIQGYFVFPGNYAYAMIPKWSYWKKGELINSNSDPNRLLTDITVTVAGDVPNLELYGMLTGDFDGSLVPTMAKSADPSLTLAENSNLQVGANQAFELPLRAASAMQVSAVSMILDIPSELATVKNVKIKGSNDPVMWSINGNELRIGWYSLNPVNVAENGALVTLELMATNAFTQGRTLDIALPFNQLNELADGNFEAMEYAELMVAKVGNMTVGNIAIDRDGGLQFSNYPNPFSKVTTLEYNLPVDGKVTINLFNNLGQLVSVLVDAQHTAGQHTFRYESSSLQPGIYVAKLRLVNSETDMVGTIKLSVQK